MKTRPQISATNGKLYLYHSLLCGRSYIDETGGSLALHNLREGLEKSQLAQYSMPVKMIIGKAGVKLGY